MTPDPRRRTVRAALKSRAYATLAALGGREMKRPLTVSATDGEIRVEMIIGPASAPEGGSLAPGSPPAGVYGLFLAPLEAAVVNALLAGGCREGKEPALSGKQVAARCARGYDTQLKYALVLMEERRIIIHQPGQGYRLTGPPRDPGMAA